MNSKLTMEICKHILSNFGIIPSTFFDSQSFKTLNSDEFLLDKSLVFLDDNDKEVHKKVWGCSASFNNVSFSILLADLTQDDLVSYCFIVQMENAPAYGFYIDVLGDEAIISCTTNNTNWTVCTTYLEATFLAAMEQLRGTGLPWGRIKDYGSQLSLLKSLIVESESLIGNSDEG